MAGRRDPNPKAKVDPIAARSFEKKRTAKQAALKRTKTTKATAERVRSAGSKIPALPPKPAQGRLPRHQSVRADVLYRPEVLAEMTKLAAIGLPDSHIAAALDITQERFHNDKGKYPEVAAAIAKGRAQGHAAVAGSLFNAAQGGNFQAQTYYLERIHRETWKPDPMRLETANTNVNVEAKTQQLARLRAFVPGHLTTLPQDAK